MLYRLNMTCFGSFDLTPRCHFVADLEETKMPSWPGGPCPKCGEDIPANIIHCRTCRALLNPELERDSVEIPVFIPLQEIDAMIEINPVGLFVDCPKCAQELKINRKYLGQRVACKFCSADFRLDPANPTIVAADVYSKCPHCEQELRFAKKYIGVRVACRFCSGKLHIQPPVEVK